MLNPILTTAVTSVHAALASVPFTAPDDEMNAAVKTVSQAVDRVCRIPAFNMAESQVKLALVSALDGWEVCQGWLVARGLNEQKTIQAQLKLY